MNYILLTSTDVVFCPPQPSAMIPVKGLCTDVQKGEHLDFDGTQAGDPDVFPLSREVLATNSC